MGLPTMLNTAACTKCGGEMDEGKIKDDKLWYTSLKSSMGFFSNTSSVKIHHVRACLSCGYLEMYLNPLELAKKIAAA